MSDIPINDNVNSELLYKQRSDENEQRKKASDNDNDDEIQQSHVNQYKQMDKYENIV